MIDRWNFQGFGTRRKRVSCEDKRAVTVANREWVGIIFACREHRNHISFKYHSGVIRGSTNRKTTWRASRLRDRTWTSLSICNHGWHCQLLSTRDTSDQPRTFQIREVTRHIKKHSVSKYFRAISPPSYGYLCFVCCHSKSCDSWRWLGEQHRDTLKIPSNSKWDTTMRNFVQLRRVSRSTTLYQ